MWPSAFFLAATNYDASFRIARTRCAANHSQFPAYSMRISASWTHYFPSSFLRLNSRWRVLLRDTASPLLYKFAIESPIGSAETFDDLDIRIIVCSALEGHVSQTKSFVLRAVALKYNASCRGAVADGGRFTKTSAQPNTEAIQR